jgi:hypothetical protein
MECNESIEPQGGIFGGGPSFEVPLGIEVSPESSPFLGQDVLVAI